jgi:A/G-specific adenine glycosylase
MKNQTHALLNWYLFHKRDFPWRTEVYQHPHLWVYHTWICEIMSQQTLIRVVLPKFKEFVKQLPDLESLANCSDDVLRYLWSGLGYYARARNLRKGAQFILDHFKGSFPTTKEQWLLVPGCGDYTASIIASICFSENVAAVDGNMIRVASRLLCLKEGVWDKRGQEKIKNHMTEMLKDYFTSSGRLKNVTPGDFNQAIMDLGSMVCKKNNPLCHECPVQSHCQAFKNNMVSECPPVKPRKAFQDEHLVALAIRNKTEDSYLLVERENGFLSKTSGFLLYAQKEGYALSALVEEARKSKFNYKLYDKMFSHSITNHKIKGSVLHIELREEDFSSSFFENFKMPNKKNWILKHNLAKELSSSLDQKVLKILS